MAFERGEQRVQQVLLLGRYHFQLRTVQSVGLRVELRRSIAETQFIGGTFERLKESEMCRVAVLDGSDEGDLPVELSANRLLFVPMGERQRECNELLGQCGILRGAKGPDQQVLANRVTLQYCQYIVSIDT